MINAFRKSVFLCFHFAIKIKTFVLPILEKLEILYNFKVIFSKVQKNEKLTFGN